MSDKEYARLSKEEIARQFMLPERKSKIATLLKQDGQEYCICRSSDSSRFMIGCDSCEEWYHGDCINITEREAKYIKQYFCIRCQEEDPTLETKFKPHKKKGEGHESRLSDGYEFRKSEGHEPKRRKDPSYEEESSPTKYKRPNGEDRKVRKIKSSADRKQHSSHGSHRRRKDSSSDGEHASRSYSDKPRQCLGPSCTNHSRTGSKYCSDDCGMKLATNRIYQVLPQRIQEWSIAPCIAEEGNKRSLENVRKQQAEVRRNLQELDKRNKELDGIIARARNAVIDPRFREETEEEGESSTYCITCGHEIHSRTAIKHFEKCFNKYESQSSFGSIYKTRIEGNNMFCDFYNPANRTYCKRLRVLCPEHCKEPKVSATEVCGCPLVVNVFELTGEFCRAPKKSCLKHYCWEKLRRAEIDMERVRQLLKIDELIEQERQLRHLLTNRAGVMALLLHSTFDHEGMEAIHRRYQNEAAQQAANNSIMNMQQMHQ
uniref:CXXC-type zinc finger protein 1 n=2 Tax=Timema TaxID=61471 RepID=A0A7R9FJ78_9NEOP|nr:unnamed protein product [Timema bartmani]CAD7453742.1 unnamed protein product [Timema tahoe]